MTRYWTVPREWEGETAFLLGGGPSLRGFDASVLAGRRVIAINCAWELKPDATVIYFCDSSFWNNKRPPEDSRYAHYRTNREAILDNFRGDHIVSVQDLVDDRVKVLRNGAKKGMILSRDPGWLAHGSNSGYQAIGLAVLFGARRIVLLGYDMKVDGKQSHFHSGHRFSDPAARGLGHSLDKTDPIAAEQHKLTKTFMPHFARLVQPLADLGIDVINATPGSALKCWPYRRLDEILRESAHIAA